MLNLNTNAHSSDVLEIAYVDSQPCVRKTFLRNIARAAKNVSKQQEFQEIKMQGVSVRAVPVMDFLVSGDQAQLLMPYIRGISGDDFSVESTATMASSISSGFSQLLEHQMKSIHFEDISKELFLLKIEDILNQTINPSLKNPLLDIKKFILGLPDFISFPIGKCHGDLTLSNVVMTPNNEIFLIDFLYTYLETPLQDVAKLKQEFNFGWSFRKCHTHLQLKSQIFLKYAYPKKMVELEAIYPTQIQLLTLLTLARIAPYVRDPQTENWLHNSLILAIKNVNL